MRRRYSESLLDTLSILEISMGQNGSPDFFTLYGFWTGVVGVVVSVTGFGITVQQLLRTKKAAQAAADAVADVRGQLYTFGAGVELSKAIEAAKQAQRYIKQCAWDYAIESYTNINESITVLLASVPDMKVSHRKALSVYRDEFRKMCELIDSPDFAGGSDISQKMRGRLRSLIDILLEVRISLENGL